VLDGTTRKALQRLSQQCRDTRASTDFISGYLPRETSRAFRISVLFRKVHTAGRPDGNFWGLGVHPQSSAKRGKGATPPRATRHSSVGQQLVADAPDRSDVVAEGAELLAQAHDVRVDGAVEAIELEAPDTLQQELAAIGAAGQRGQQVQQLELLWRQVDLLRDGVA